MAGRTPLGVQLEQALFESQSAKTQAHRAELELEQFKQKVRDVALEVRADNGWCVDGFNSVMEDLGLEKLPTSFTIEVEVPARQIVTVAIDAEDLNDNRTAEGAQQYLLDNPSMVVNAVYSYGWEIMYDGLKIESVESDVED